MRSSPSTDVPDRSTPAVSDEITTIDSGHQGSKKPSAEIGPVGIVICVLALLIAIPILIRGNSAAVEVDASQSSTTSAAVNSTVSTTSAPPTTDATSTLANPTAALRFNSLAPDDRVESAAETAAATSSTTGETGTTAAPTTAAPTTASPTTAVPTTAPTVVAPTTAAPTTAAPTTAAPTTAAPTTAGSSSDGETSAPPAGPEAEAPLAAPASKPQSDDVPAGEPSSGEEAPLGVGSEPGDPTPHQWEVLRQCESGGNYTIVSSNGLYYGAYQFHPQTWDGVARSSARPDLVGILPSQAEPIDQDYLALRLWRSRGWAPWPVCGRKAAAAG